MSLRYHKVGQNRYCEIFMSTLIGWCEYIFAEIMISAINNKLLYLVCIIYLHCEPKHIYGLESVVAMELRLSCTNPSICCLHLAALAIYNNCWLWHVQPNNPHAWLSSLQFVTRSTWKHFPRYWPFVRGIHQSPVNSPHKGQWRGALMFSLILVWINDWGNNREAGDLRRHRAHYDVIVMHAGSKAAIFRKN